MKAEPNRDRAVDRWLRRTRPTDADAQASASCLDPETLAAWIDGGLGDQAIAMAEAHASRCPRCQALVGAMARTMPVSPARAPWWRREWTVRWLVPLTAGAAAVALWMIVPEPSRSVPPVAERASQARPATPPSAGPAGVDRFEVQSQAAPEKPRAAPSAAADEARALKRETPGMAARAPAATEAPRGARADDRNVPKPEIAADAKPVREQPLELAPAAPPAAAAAPATAPTEMLGRLSAAVTMGEIASPDPAVRWRLGAGGSVQYSRDSGATWESLSTGVSTELRAGSSSSTSVCWLVGDGGVVLLTTDGRRWQRVPFPEPVDLANVQATDAQTASVTTSDGRTFRTTDAGQTWSRTPLQVF